MKIIVDGKPINVLDTRVTYDQIVAHAGERGHPSVTYRARISADAERSGTMYPGCTPVWIAEGMVFSVMHTGNA